MGRPDYKSILHGSLSRYAELVTQREAISDEIYKLNEFIEATINLLPEADRSEWESLMETVARIQIRRMSSLTDAVKRVLQDDQGKYFTAAQVRDKLVSSGFDFSNYSSNPLSSISTTLRRMKPSGDVEVVEAGDVMAYRWKGTLPMNALLRKIPPMPPG